jgi:hypothetical protein
LQTATVGLLLGANDKIDFSKERRNAQAEACGNCGRTEENGTGIAQTALPGPLESRGFRGVREKMEASEIHEFSEQLQEGAEKRLMFVSLIIAILAVLVAMVTVLGHRAHTHAVLEQTRAADQWNEYQARRIRVQQTQIANDLLSLQPTKDPAATQARLATYKAEITKWQAELHQDMEKAHELEARVDHEEREAARFDLGEALLQVAVVLASITLLTRHHRYVWSGVVLATVGLVIAASAFFVK